jgi:pimeloyl-ACP methyl ester carboxylesterase
MMGMTIALALLALVAGLGGFAAYTRKRVETAVPPQGRFLDIEGERIHYVDKGAGPAVFMIHGLAGQLGNFTHSLVGRLAGEFRVIAVDRPGSGYSTRPAGAPAGPRAQAKTLAKVIRALNLERPLIVGHSLGGAVALAIALDHPDCVSGLALIAPLTRAMRKPPVVFRGLAVASPLVRRLVAWTLATPASMLTADWALKEVFAPEMVPADFMTAGGGLLGWRPGSFHAASSDLAAVNDDLKEMAQHYASLRVPVGILFARGDNLLDWRMHGETMKQKVPDLDLTIVDGGHMLPVTAPGVVADFIRRIARLKSTKAGAAGE